MIGCPSTTKDVAGLMKSKGSSGFCPPISLMCPLKTSHAFRQVVETGSHSHVVLPNTHYLTRKLDELDQSHLDVDTGICLDVDTEICLDVDTEICLDVDTEIVDTEMGAQERSDGWEYLFLPCAVSEELLQNETGKKDERNDSRIKNNS